MEKKLILLVEDNPSDVDLTRRALEKNRICNELMVAEDGQEALDYLLGADPATGQPAHELPAVVLLDLQLPKVQGLEILRALRADRRTKCLPVVVLTSSRQEQDITESYNLGANSYIRKPVDFHQFADAVKHLGLYWLVLNEAPPERC